MKNLLLISTLGLAACGSGESALEFDSYERVSYNSKAVEKPCPENAVVFFIAGQSNAANSANFVDAFSDKVFQYYKGKCYTLVSPVLGAGGDWFNPFQKVLVDYSNRTGKNVIVSFFSIGGKSVRDFANTQPASAYYTAWRQEYNELNSYKSVDYFLWQQGETDAYNDLGGQVYISYFNSVVDQIKNPLIARSTICADLNEYNNEIGNAQVWLQNWFKGPNTDLEVPKVDRHDGCHFGITGVEKFSIAWNKYLR